MPVVAIEGRAGSLAPELGHLVADELKIDFVDRLLLAEIGIDRDDLGPLTNGEPLVPDGWPQAESVQSCFLRT